jgi:murein DD-endopeptidase MepM/ murein hydrolase activator NlpD
MKNRLIITISDINGSKQYNVHEFIKHIILWIIFIFILITIGIYLYIDILNRQISQEQQREKILKLANIKLTAQKVKLKEKINEEKERLHSMNEMFISMNNKLREIEDAIGIGPDINASFFDRVDENVKKIEESKIEQERRIQALKDEAQKRIESAKISAIQKAFLINGIPNGKPLQYRRVSSPFGYRVHPVTKVKDFHAGIDLSAKIGTPIYAPANGVVEYAKNKGAYGKFLLIAHAYGFKTAYGHLSRYAVKSGQYVTKGQLIGYVGNTGRSTGPHLHYEIRYLNKWVNPKIFINWNTDDIAQIVNSVSNVNWGGIFKQIQNSIDLVK